MIDTRPAAPAETTGGVCPPPFQHPAGLCPNKLHTAPAFRFDSVGGPNGFPASSGRQRGGAGVRVAQRAPVKALKVSNGALTQHDGEA